MHQGSEKFTSQNVQIFGYVYRSTKWPKSWSSVEDPVVLLERNLYGHLLAGLLVERQFEKVLLEHRWEKVFGWERGLFLSVYVDDIQLAGKTENMEPTWKILMKDVEPTSFLDHVYLGCTQRQCQISKDIVDNYRTMVESRISAGGLEKLPFSQNLRTSSWSYDMVGHAKKCVERYCELANKTTQQLYKYKVSTPCIDARILKTITEPCSNRTLLKIPKSECPDILISLPKHKWPKSWSSMEDRVTPH